MPRTPSCTAPAISLRYLFFFMTLNLRKLVSLYHDLDPACIEGQDHRAVILQIPLILFADVCMAALGELQEENRAAPGAVCNDGAVSTALSLASPGYPLLDETCPRSASIKPRSARITASQSLASSNRS